MNEFTENECLPNFELKFNFFENLRKPLTLQNSRKRIDIDFERVSIECALARLTKIENVWFCSWLSLAMRFKKNSLRDE